MTAAILLFLSLALPAIAATNPPPITLTNLLKLTPEQERLNQSEFYMSRINDFDQTINHWLLMNNVGESWQKPSVNLGAWKRVQYQSLLLPPTVEYWLTLQLYTESMTHWVSLPPDAPLLLMIDGTKVTVHPDPLRFVVSEDVFNQQSFFPINEQLLRTLGSARRVQMRMEKVDRTLSSTNLARFKVFVKAFIDGAPAKSGLTSATTNQPPRGREYFECSNLSFRIVETSGAYWDVAWRMTVRNHSTRSIRENVDVQLLDAKGFVVDSDPETINLNAGETRNLTGSLPVRASLAPTITKAQAHWRK